MITSPHRGLSMKEDWIGYGSFSSRCSWELFQGLDCQYYLGSDLQIEQAIPDYLVVVCLDGEVEHHNSRTHTHPAAAT